jgi:methylmalonyl-CoA epimerase
MTTRDSSRTTSARDRMTALAETLAARYPSDPETSALLEELTATTVRTERPMLDHVGMAVRDLQRAAQLYVDGLGGELVAGGLEPDTGLRSLHVAFPGGGKIELLEPTKAGPVADFIERRGEGVHHLTVLVDDIPASASRLSDLGFSIVGVSEDSPVWHEAYVSPRSALGCLLQLVRPGPGYGKPVAISLEEVLAGQWTWEDRSPKRVGPAAPGR